MTTDGYRGITITYNDLDLPSEISKGQTKISYIYSARGEKLAQEVATSSGSSLTYYRGVMVYNGNALDYILHPAGVTRKVSSGYVYDYYLTDHLGSTRVVLEASGNTLVPIQTTEYYPFGLAFANNNLDKNKYLFSGKEIQNVTFGNEMLGMYDFGSRFYDPLLNRWFCQDPASQLVSPYGYCANNPVINIDPNGELFWEAALIGAVFGGFWSGMKAESQGKNFWSGAWKGALTGSVGGALAQVGGAGMTFAQNLLLGVGEGMATGALDAAIWKENVWQGMLWGGAGGALWTTLTSENLKNWGNGKGWKTNETRFNEMIGSGMAKQDILDELGINAVYDPNRKTPKYVLDNNEYWGCTDPKGNIYFGDRAFDSYHGLIGTYYKESYHRNNILSGKGITYADDPPANYMRIYPEEAYGFKYAHINNGLYPKSPVGYINQANAYWIPLHGVNFIKENTLWRKIINNIYKIPRRW
ncbi:MULTISPECIES: RHS repeat domain-containing protein [Butyricimonas]|uniref:RHS repeat domain-containing protein n=1 Tax=Butyricimonas TaxID=574697 RepID=UPI0007FB55BE|nr:MULTISPECIES: RHS repeat-associated core domain-containing protein [Butyricimonas]